VTGARIPKGAALGFGMPTVAGFHFDPETTNALWETIGKQINKLLAEQGPVAFETPRSSAIAHEVGHCIQAAHDGICVERVRVFTQQAFGQVAWVGWTDSSDPRCLIGPDTAPELILKRACSLIAGVVAEAVLDRGGYRDGSSLDEVVVAQLLIGQLTLREEYNNIDPPRLWDACWGRTAALLKHNEAPARDLMRKLDLTQTVRGSPLAKVMAQVQHLPGDVLDVHALLQRWGSHR
jgi:hypothetical protein